MSEVIKEERTNQEPDFIEKLEHVVDQDKLQRVIDLKREIKDELFNAGFEPREINSFLLCELFPQLHTTLY